MHSLIYRHTWAITGSTVSAKHILSTYSIHGCSVKEKTSCQIDCQLPIQFGPPHIQTNYLQWRENGDYFKVSNLQISYMLIIHKVTLLYIPSLREMGPQHLRGNTKHSTIALVTYNSIETLF